MIEELIDKTFHIRDASHIAHWKTKSYSEHMALGDYYEDIIEKIDELIEAYQGTFGIIGKVQEQDTDIAKSINDMIIWLNENRSEIGRNVASIENIVDELTALNMRTLYKLENLKQEVYYVTS